MKIQGSPFCLTDSIYKHLFDRNTVPQLIFEVNYPLFTVRDLNLASQTAFKCSKKELIGKSIYEIPCHLHSAEDFSFSVETVLRTKEALETAEFSLIPLLDSMQEVEFLFLSLKTVKQSNADQLKLQQSEEKFRFLSECLPQQVWTIDESGTVDYFNEYTQRYFSESDLKEETKIWKADSGNWIKYVHTDDIAKVNATWEHANRTATMFRINYRLRRGDGMYRWHLAMAHPVLSGDKIVKWLGTNTDIDDIKQIEKRKDEFISMASHELKTPMTSLKGYMQLISDTITDENGRLYIDRGLIQIGRIEKLIADLLDVSKITTGKIDYNMASFDFYELINETVRNFKLTNNSHELTLVSNAKFTVYGDRYRFEQVLINFLSNAVKYSPNAGTIRIKSVKVNEKLVVSIQDFGIGINKSHQSRLYERFYRVDKTAILFAGLGLGLYVSSEIINRHKGSFWYESTLGSGSEFYFSLPAEDPLSPALPDLQETGAGYAQSGLNR